MTIELVALSALTLTPASKIPRGAAPCPVRGALAEDPPVARTCRQPVMISLSVFC